jgi:NAD(P)-dependent dehydrogenase (short-subunit alcohol dehydrogenase family)
VEATARRPEALSDLVSEAGAAGLRLRGRTLDVTRPETVMLPAGLRVVVNNAGLDGRYLPVEHAPDSEWRALLETNFFGALEVIRRAVPLLRAAGGGVICNVTSASLLGPVPFFGMYRAAKAALSALGESLRAEVAPFGIRVLEILPGPIATEMLAASDRLPEAAAFPAYAEVASRAQQGRRGVSGMETPPEDAARAIADAILDDTSPLRCACDPLGRGLLDSWREQGDEALAQGMLGAFRPTE